jgi:5'-deoxynucleotidase YfbR-like HD superfamily hydrolase
MTSDEVQLLAETGYRLQLAGIPRWTIIDMRRRQNVAEHSFNVLILSISLYEYMQNDVSHNKFDRESLMLWAIDHDMDEIETGDMPTPFKAEIEKLAPGVTHEALDNLMINRLPSFVSRRRGMKGSYPYDVVKIADKLEEVLYNKTHGYTLRAQYALVEGLRLIRSRLLQAEKAHPRYDWGRARDWLEYFLGSITGDSPGWVASGMPAIRELLAPA